ncbi:hypothetical protein CEXT_474441 [Caerostris extrusa]|uniref:Uncharacterized protein n=1 Tax=Caerostris extrusa TaxID=172846 RepID=A0AAV4UXF3_CAEEX|nr:hypothetical protein CEXT_474441 [Caerostris extrusa]
MPSKQQLESKYLSVQRLMEGPRRGPTPGPQTSQPHASTQSQLKRLMRWRRGWGYPPDCTPMPQDPFGGVRLNTITAWAQ